MVNCKVKLCVYKKDTISFTDLDLGSEMNIYESILTTFEVSFIFFEADRVAGKIGSSFKSNHHRQI
jgi:hypothetical protein